MMNPMVEPIDYDEIKKTFAPILEEIPKLLHKLKFCLKSDPASAQKATKKISGKNIYI